MGWQCLYRFANALHGETAPNVGVEEDHAGSDSGCCDALQQRHFFFFLFLYECMHACVGVFVPLHAPLIYVFKIKTNKTSVAPKGDEQTRERGGRKKKKKKKTWSCVALMRLFHLVWQHSTAQLRPLFSLAALRLTGKSIAQSLLLSKQAAKQALRLTIDCCSSNPVQHLNKRPVSHRPVHGPDQTIPFSLFFLLVRLLYRPF